MTKMEVKQFNNDVQTQSDDMSVSDVLLQNMGDQQTHEQNVNSVYKLAGVGEHTDTQDVGLGADIFFFDDTLELDNIDTIADFNQAEDKIDLSGIVRLDIGSSVTDYLQVSEVDSDTVITIDETGSGDFGLGYDTLILKGTVGLGDIQSMLDNQIIQISEV